MGRPTMEEPRPSPRLASIIVLDVVAFGRRDSAEQQSLRFEMYKILNRASGEQVAKLAAFAIRWPHLIALLGNADPARRSHPLAELENAARQQDQRGWNTTLRRLLPTLVPANPAPSCHDLQVFGPEIGAVAAPPL